jgi:hypothetical protein
MNGDNAQPAVLPVAAISALALAGVVVWAWLALVDSRQALNSLDALDGMHFDK